MCLACSGLGKPNYLGECDCPASDRGSRACSLCGCAKADRRVPKASRDIVGLTWKGLCRGVRVHDVHPCGSLFRGCFPNGFYSARNNLSQIASISWGYYFAAHACTRVLDFKSFAGQGQMLDGRVPGASQVSQPFRAKKKQKKENKGKKRGPRKKGKRGLNCAAHILGSLFCSHTPARSF